LSIRAARAWFGPGRAADDVQVVCEDGVITYAGPATPIGAADAELTVDGFLMPAVADRHVHIEMSDPSAVLRGGVTAVRDLGWPAARIFPLADMSEMPSFDGPLIRAAGPMITVRDGYPTRSGWAPEGAARIVDGPDDAAEAVRDVASLGAAAVKLCLDADAGPTLSDGELMAACDAARDLDVPVTVHARGEGQVERALGAGVDELAHAPTTPLSEDVIAMCARSLRIVSTLDAVSFGRDSAEVRAGLDNLRRFRDAGGTVIYGTDLGNGDVPPGIHLREVLLLVEAGLSGDDLLQALTRAPLDPDAPADLIVLGSDPLDDPNAFADLRLVVRAGRVVAET
jgi:imidazolonepropionase-like amidohydrolase